MPELRKDPTSGRSVMIATERGKRPTDFIQHREHAQVGFCPFCEGNEEKTPGEIMAYRRPGTERNSPGWWIRVVPNKFPALIAEGDLDRTGEGMYDMMNGLGSHEVVIENPCHEMSMGDYSVKQVEEIIWAFRDRMVALTQDERIRYVLIFKNHGREAGASLDHPHSQIISLPIVPKRVKEEVDGALEYYNFKERCVFCDIIRQERSSKKRVVLENDGFIAINPFASRFPFETWILPKHHSQNFASIEIAQVAQFAAVLRESLHRIKVVLDDPPYNFMLHTAPCNVPRQTYPHYHWHLEIMPKLTKVAGFEWGTGFYINPMPPEKAAAYLCETENWHEEQKRYTHVQT